MWRGSRGSADRGGVPEDSITITYLTGTGSGIVGQAVDMVEVEVVVTVSIPQDQVTCGRKQSEGYAVTEMGQTDGV